MIGDDSKAVGILQDLFHEMNAEFQRLSVETKDEFMAILYGHKTLNRATGRYEWPSRGPCDCAKSSNYGITR